MSRFTRLAGVVVALVASAVLSGPVAAASTPAPAAPPRLLEGTIRLVVADPAHADAGGKPAPSHPGTATRYDHALVTADGVYVLEGKVGRPNTRVRVKGQVAGRKVRATELQAVDARGFAVGGTSSAAAVPPAIPASGTTRILTILAPWNVPDAVTQASARAQMLADTNTWYRDVSYGAVGTTGDVTPWVRIAGPAGGQCYADRDSIMAQAQTAAAAQGFRAQAYDAVVLYFPENSWQVGSDCDGIGGWAHVGGTQVWINGHLDRRVVTHELGHTYGLNHAHSWTCADGMGGSCTFSDYGDDWDSMGASDHVGHFNGGHKAQLGWMTGRTVDLTAGGTATLAPLARDAVAVSSASIRAGAGRTYWLEYRQAIDADSTLPPEATDGLQVRVTDPSLDAALSLDGTHLIDVRTSDAASPSTATLRAGESWTSPEGVRLAVTAVTPAGVTVATSRVAPPTCVDAALEPDDTAATARPIAPNSTQRRAFCTSGDTDWVTFTATAGASYRLATSNLSGATDTVLNLFDGAGTTLLASNDDDPVGGTLASTIDFRPVTSGTYRLQVAPFGPSYGQSVGYDLRVTAPDTTKPTVTARNPAVGATDVPVAGDVTVTFSEAVSGVTGSTFTLRNAAGTAVGAAVTRNGTTNAWVLNPTADLAPDTRYTATLTGGATAVRDAAGNPLASLSWTFTTGPRPVMTTRSPGSAWTAQNVAADVKVTFSEPVAGVTGSTFAVRSAAGAAVAATVTRNGTTNQWILNPTANLAADTRYTVTLTGGAAAIRDAAGNPLATTSWTFTTGPAPVLTARSPGPNATAVSRTANVAATFSEAVTGVSATTFTLKVKATGAVVAAALTGNGTSQWILDPGATLAANTTYIATLTGGTGAIRDAGGNPLASASWTFTTQG